MTTVPLAELEPRFLEMYERASGGDTVVVSAHGVKMRLTPVDQSLLVPDSALAAVEKRGPRQLGQWKGIVEISDDFFDPMSGEELKLWYGE